MATVVRAAKSLWLYGRLSNLYFLDYNFAYLIVGTLLPASALRDRRIGLAVGLMIAGYFFIHCAAIAFDDITGFGDGGDAATYRDNPSAMRSAYWKPLLTGELQLSQALRFAWGSGLSGLMLLMCGVFVAPYHPAWLIVVAFAGACISLQYSYGLKFSHIGLQEAVLFLFTVQLILVPCIALTGTTTLWILLEGGLFAFWLMMVSWYSNLRDVNADRSIGRINVATLTGERIYIRLLGVLAVADAVGLAGLAAAGVVPWTFVLFLCPVFVLRLLQFALGGLRQNPLLGRLLGRRLACLGAILMMIANVVVPLRPQ